jgi:hypothetical protein
MAASSNSVNGQGPVQVQGDFSQFLLDDVLHPATDDVTAVVRPIITNAAMNQIGQGSQYLTRTLVEPLPPVLQPIGNIGVAVVTVAGGASAQRVIDKSLEKAEESVKKSSTVLVTAAEKSSTVVARSLGCSNAE